MERAVMLKQMAKYLTGAEGRVLRCVRRHRCYYKSHDCWIDIDGGIGTLFACTPAKGGANSPTETFYVDGAVERVI